MVIFSHGNQEKNPAGDPPVPGALSAALASGMDLAWLPNILQSNPYLHHNIPEAEGWGNPRKDGRREVRGGKPPEGGGWGWWAAARGLAGPSGFRISSLHFRHARG